MSAAVLFIDYLMMAAGAGALVALWFTRPRPSERTTHAS